MSAPKMGEPKAVRNTPRNTARAIRRLSATPAEVAGWFNRMVDAGQFPAVLDFGPVFDASGALLRETQEQISVGGREYDNAQDADRWWWMRDHATDVTAWLKANGHAARMNFQAETETLARLTRLLGAKGGAK